MRGGAGEGLAQAEIPLEERGAAGMVAAARDTLMRLPGVGEVTANRIIEGRPYAGIDELVRVPGIGATTLERIRPFLKVSK